MLQDTHHRNVFTCSWIDLPGMHVSVYKRPAISSGTREDHFCCWYWEREEGTKYRLCECFLPCTPMLMGTFPGQVIFPRFRRKDVAVEIIIPLLRDFFLFMWDLSGGMVFPAYFTLLTHSGRCSSPITLYLIFTKNHLRSRDGINPPPTRLMSDKASERRRQPRTFYMDPLSREWEAAGGVIHLLLTPNV